MERGTAVFIHPSAVEHDTGPGHPEHAGRVRAIESALDAVLPQLADRVVRLRPGPASRSEILRVHPEAHIAALEVSVARATELGRPVEFASETPVSEASNEAIMTSLGGVVEACDGVLAGRWQNAFVVTRPPGHHCEADRAMGFCPVNAVAIGARRLVETGGASRVLILDWDVHHGNGTESIFRADPDVYYLSLHQAPWYPGTGAASYRGIDDGEGATRNVPLPAGTDATVFLAALEMSLGAALEEFDPEFILVSSGFDALAGDPLGGFLLEPEDFHAATRHVVEVAERVCSGRVVALLEGGYDPPRTAAATIEVVRALARVESGHATLRPPAV